MEPNSEQTAPLGTPPSFEDWKASRSSSQPSVKTSKQTLIAPPTPPPGEGLDTSHEKPTSPDLNKLIGDANGMTTKDRSILLDLLDHSPEKEQEFARMLNMYDNMSEKDQEYFKNHLKK